jgi:hypothetical protein
MANTVHYAYAKPLWTRRSIFLSLLIDALRSWCQGMAEISFATMVAPVAGANVSSSHSPADSSLKLCLSLFYSVARLAQSRRASR